MSFLSPQLTLFFITNFIIYFCSLKCCSVPLVMFLSASPLYLPPTLTSIHTSSIYPSPSLPSLPWLHPSLLPPAATSCYPTHQSFPFHRFPRILHNLSFIFYPSSDHFSASQITCVFSPSFPCLPRKSMLVCSYFSWEGRHPTSLPASHSHLIPSPFPLLLILPLSFLPFPL